MREYVLESFGLRVNDDSVVLSVMRVRPERNKGMHTNRVSGIAISWLTVCVQCSCRKDSYEVGELCECRLRYDL